MKKTILFVDDEPSILSAIKRVFRKSPYTVLTADTAESALELIRTVPIAVLVSDYTMPGKTGAQLLAKARDIRPDMTRIILSGNGDQEAAIQSINYGAASRFLTKPWDDAELTCEIHRAVATWEAARYINLEKKLLHKKAFYETLDALISTEQSNQHALVYFGIRDYQKIQHRLYRDQAAEFLAHIAPTPSGVKECLALGLLDDGHYGGLITLENDTDEPAIAVSNFVNQFAHQVEFDNQNFNLHIDAGYCPIAIADKNEGATALMDKAILAFNHVKPSKSNYFIGYDSSMEKQNSILRILENDLHSSLTENEFVLYYQPKINTLDGSMYGAEALIRWNCKQLGMLPPNDFIPLAERGDSIIDIGQWVMDEAAHQWMSWFGTLDRNTTVSVNVSQKQLQDSTFLKRLENVLTETGIEASMFELEITESLLMEDITATIGILDEIKSLGVMLSIDDFGTGYSSLSQLNNLPVDTLKIDRSFILPMLESKISRDLVRNLITMGHDLGIDIVAEGVEDEEQLNLLKGYGCDVIQGYYFSPPVPAHEYIKLVDKFQLDNAGTSQAQQFRAAS